MEVVLPLPIKIEEEEIPVKVECIDLDDYVSPEEIVEKWSTNVRNTLKTSFMESKMTLEDLMKWYLTTLIDLDDAGICHSLIYYMEKHIQYFYHYSKELIWFSLDDYLECMEDILAIFLDIQSKLYNKEKDRKKNSKKRKRILRILKNYLLNREDSIHHVLMKIKINEAHDDANNFIDNIFSVVMSSKPINKSDLAYCRAHILFKKWKKLKNREVWDKLDMVLAEMYSRPSGSIHTINIWKQISQQTSQNSVLDVLAQISNSDEILCESYFKFIKNQSPEIISEDHNSTSYLSESESDSQGDSSVLRNILGDMQLVEQEEPAECKIEISEKETTDDECIVVGEGTLDCNPDETEMVHEILDDDDDIATIIYFKRKDSSPSINNTIANTRTVPNTESSFLDSIDIVETDSVKVTSNNSKPTLTPSPPVLMKSPNLDNDSVKAREIQSRKFTRKKDTTTENVQNLLSEELILDDVDDILLDLETSEWESKKTVVIDQTLHSNKDKDQDNFENETTLSEIEDNEVQGFNENKNLENNNFHMPHSTFVNHNSPKSTEIRHSELYASPTFPDISSTCDLNGVDDDDNIEELEATEIDDIHHAGEIMIKPDTSSIKENNPVRFNGSPIRVETTRVLQESRTVQAEANRGLSTHTEAAKDQSIHIEKTKGAPNLVENTRVSPTRVESTKEPSIHIERTKGAPNLVENTRLSPTRVESTKEPSIHIERTKGDPNLVENTRVSPTRVESTKEPSIHVDILNPGEITKEPPTESTNEHVESTKVTEIPPLRVESVESTQTNESSEEKEIEIVPGKHLRVSISKIDINKFINTSQENRTRTRSRFKHPGDNGDFIGNLRINSDKRMGIMYSQKIKNDNKMHLRYNDMKGGFGLDDCLKGNIEKLNISDNIIKINGVEFDLFNDGPPNNINHGRSLSPENTNYSATSPSDLTSPDYDGIDDFRNYYLANYQPDNANNETSTSRTNPSGSKTPNGKLKRKRIVFVENDINTHEHTPPRTDKVHIQGILKKDTHRDDSSEDSSRKRLEDAESSSTSNNPRGMMLYRVNYDKSTPWVSENDKVHYRVADNNWRTNNHEKIDSNIDDEGTVESNDDYIHIPTSCKNICCNNLSYELKNLYLNPSDSIPIMSNFPSNPFRPKTLPKTTQDTTTTTTTTTPTNNDNSFISQELFTTNINNHDNYTIDSIHQPAVIPEVEEFEKTMKMEKVTKISTIPSDLHNLNLRKFSPSPVMNFFNSRSNSPVQSFFSDYCSCIDKINSECCNFDNNKSHIEENQEFVNKEEQVHTSLDIQHLINQEPQQQIEEYDYKSQKIINENPTSTEIESDVMKLPLKKRKHSVANAREEDYDDDEEDFIAPDVIEEILKRARAEAEEEENDDISYPAKPAISIAEIQDTLVTQQPPRIFKTPAQKKEMPLPPPPPPLIANPHISQLPPRIITEQYNNHTYNNPTINYHMNNVPYSFFSCPSLTYFSPILVPTTFDMKMVNSTQQPSTASGSDPNVRIKKEKRSRKRKKE